MFNDNAGTSLPVLDSDCAEQGQETFSSSSSASSKRGRPRKTRESKRQPKSSTRTPKREKKEELVEVTFFPSSSSSLSSSSTSALSSSLVSSGHATEGPNKEKSPSLKTIPQRDQVLVPNLCLETIKRDSSLDDVGDKGEQAAGLGHKPKTPKRSPSSADREKRGDRLLDGTGRLKWTPELHHKFELAVKKFGVQTALPTQILHEMQVEGLTRHHISSHLQKFRFEKFGVKRKKELNDSPRDDDQSLQQQQQQQQEDGQDHHMPMNVVYSDQDQDQDQSPIPYPLDVHVNCSPPEDFMHPPHPPLYYSSSPLDSPSGLFPDSMGLYRLQDDYITKDFLQSSESDQQTEASKSRFAHPSGFTKPLLIDPSSNPSGPVFPLSYSTTATASTSSASSSTTTTTVVRRRCSTGTTPLSKTMPSVVVQKSKPKRLSQSARLNCPAPLLAPENPTLSLQPPPVNYEQHSGHFQQQHQHQHQQQQVYLNAPSSNNPFQAENVFDNSSHMAFPSSFPDPQMSSSSTLHSSSQGFPSGNLATTTLSRTSSSSSSSRETITQTYHHHHHQHQHHSLPTFPSSSFSSSSFTDRSSPFQTQSPSVLSLEAFPSSSTSTRDSSSSSSSSSRPPTPSSTDPVFPSFFSSSSSQQHQHHNNNNSSLPPYYEPNILGQLQQQQFFNPSHHPSSSPYFDQTQQFFQHNYGSFYATQDDPMTGPVVTVTGAHTVGGQVSSSLSSTMSSTKSHGENLTNSLQTTFGTSHSSSDQTMLSPVFSPSPGTPFSRSRSPSPSPQAPSQPQLQSHPQPQPHSSFIPLPFTSFNSQ